MRRVEHQEAWLLHMIRVHRSRSSRPADNCSCLLERWVQGKASECRRLYYYNPVELFNNADKISMDSVYLAFGIDPTVEGIDGNTFTRTLNIINVGGGRKWLHWGMRQPNQIWRCIKLNIEMNIIARFGWLL